MGSKVQRRQRQSRDEILRELRTKEILDDLVRGGELIDNLDGTYSIPNDSIPPPLKN